MKCQTTYFVDTREIWYVQVDLLLSYIVQHNSSHENTSRS
jgi:hypothetical protein